MIASLSAALTLNRFLFLLNDLPAHGLRELTAIFSLHWDIRLFQWVIVYLLCR